MDAVEIRIRKFTFHKLKSPKLGLSFHQSTSFDAHITVRVGTKARTGLLDPRPQMYTIILYTSCEDVRMRKSEVLSSANYIL